MMDKPVSEPFRIVSGGQTGVDRAALDAALEQGVPAGGWCPEGRFAEDGPIAAKYPLKELAGGGYRERTLQNVIDSDGTLIIYFGELSGGTDLTREYCISESKPHLLIDGSQTGAAEAARLIAGFVRENRIGILNVAGPRASKDDRAYSYCRDVLLEFLADDGQDSFAHKL